MNKAKGEKGPDLSQGTPIQEVVKGDKEAQEKLPKVMKDALKASETPGSKRNFSTSAARRAEEVSSDAVSPMDGAIVASGTQSMTTIPEEEEAATTSLKLEDIVEPLPALRPEDSFNRRYPAIVDQLVGLLMQDGKKSLAQKVCYS